MTLLLCVIYLPRLCGMVLCYMWCGVTGWLARCGVQGVFWFNPSETYIDISDGGTAQTPHKESHWMSESGDVDFFLFSGPKPADTLMQFTALVGRQQLPPMFSLGYHQCRWNYRCV